jgi:hypothetical protein
MVSQPCGPGGLASIGKAPSGPSDRNAPGHNKPDEQDEPSKPDLSVRERLVFLGETLVEGSAYKAKQLNPLDDPRDGPRTGHRASNIIAGAITLGISVIILIMMMLIAGYFVAEAPADGAYQEEINTTQDVSGTAFIIFGVSLLAIPTVAVVAYFYANGLGGFVGGGPQR